MKANIPPKINLQVLKDPNIDIETLSSQAGQSARSRLTTASLKSKASRHSAASSSYDRLRSGYSGRSGARSHTPSTASSYSGLTSASSANQDEILRRIQGLEAALLKERALRERMQAILEERTLPATAAP